MILNVVGQSDIGREREINQDAFGAWQSDDAGLFVVADVMGGHADGEKASQLVVVELLNWWNSFSPVLFEYNFREMLSSVEMTVEYANTLIYDRFNHNDICGTTVTVLFIYHAQYGIIHVGDSRCYMLRSRCWKCLTVDEIWENQNNLSIAERNMLNHPNRGKLINAVGVKKYVSSRIVTDVLQKNIVFLLCTDGIYKYCSDRDLKRCVKMCRKDANMKLAGEKMVDLVYNNSARDNLTFIIVKCSEI